VCVKLFRHLTGGYGGPEIALARRPKWQYEDWPDDDKLSYPGGVDGAYQPGENRAIGFSTARRPGD
jgi:hypothetical protein